MARHRGIDGPPRSYLVRGGWPDGEVSQPEAEAVRQLCVELATAVEEVGLRELARRAQMSHSSLTAIVGGKVWPDAVSLARLEAAVGRPLWPSGRP